MSTGDNIGLSRDEETDGVERVEEYGEDYQEEYEEEEEE